MRTAKSSDYIVTNLSSTDPVDILNDSVAASGSRLIQKWRLSSSRYNTNRIKTLVDSESVKVEEVVTLTVPAARSERYKLLGVHASNRRIVTGSDLLQRVWSDTSVERLAFEQSCVPVNVGATAYLGVGTTASVIGTYRLDIDVAIVVRGLSGRRTIAAANDVNLLSNMLSDRGGGKAVLTANDKEYKGILCAVVSWVDGLSTGETIELKGVFGAEAALGASVMPVFDEVVNGIDILIESRNDQLIKVIPIAELLISRAGGVITETYTSVEAKSRLLPYTS